MKKFTSVKDVKDAQAMADLGLELKKNPFAFQHLGKNKTMGIIFLNPSLRTRLSTQKAAKNLGMDVMVMNFTGEGWNLETEDGIVMDGNTQEHIKEAAAVIGQYCDIIGIRSFPKFENRELDYSEKLLNDVIKYCGCPVVSLESATLHPLQSLADLITITELKKVKRPKVVLTWAPHPRKLPQAVSNSFAEWMNSAEVDLVITHPEGYDLAPEFVGNATVTNNQEEAFKDADFIHAKNWSSYLDYGKTEPGKYNDWMVDEEKMALTNGAKFMHCLPVRRNVVVSDGVLDSDSSVVIQEAGNREWSAQAVLKTMLDNL